ncbi:class I SAM-dependent methyltransferase [Agrococcus baldri]|uniref:Ribosomal RNA large subunit methyltransferase G n=1 Tax=Agrococcus baldri TaxID=153730 RepID=A0AA87RFP7_9MICO|nr:methyltransferase [Agrococcus baldri]GEK78783.1 ribosomal RNA large subunit methyltransferase G [Agrococcus baldri]
MTDRDELFSRLRRRPDVEDPALQAHDASDALILDEAAKQRPRLGEVVVIGDRHGALTLGALQAGATGVRVHQDVIVGERALDANAAELGDLLPGAGGYAHHPLDASLVEGAGLVLLQLPRALDALDEIAELIATHADERVRVIAGGRVKHMSMSMNALLGRSFRHVHASLGRRKSRVLHAEGPLRPGISWPRTRRHEVAGRPLTVVAHGAAFAGTSVDIGARTLLQHLDQMPDARGAIDLACGTGVLGVALALARPELRVLATDASAAAIASTRATAEANGVAGRVTARRADGLEGVADASAELILLNPPFHVGAAVHTGAAERLIADAGRALAPGGELWCVWNSPLGYRPLLERVGETRQVSRNAKFTVTATRR